MNRSPAEQHPRKRLRDGDDGRRSKSVSPLPTPVNASIGLPVEVWAEILEFCAFREVMMCSAANRAFTREVLPLVTKLFIYHKDELRVEFARRFGNGKAKQIDVFCLITCVDPDGDEEKFSICQYTCSRIVPFLSHFPNLKTVGLDVDHQGIPLNSYFRDTFVQEDSVETIRSLVRSLCGGFGSGAFPKNLKLFGPAFQAGTFICYRERGCNLCNMYCNSFPLNEAVNARATCISVQERLDIISKRPGGSEILSSPEMVLELLRHHYEVSFRMETSPNEFIEDQAIVYGKDVLEELAILCKNYFDPRLLPSEVVTEALGSSAEDDKVWLVQKYHEFLTDLGLALDDSILLVDESNLLSEVHHHM